MKSGTRQPVPDIVRQSLDFYPTAACLFDADGMLTAVNHRAIRLLGFEPSLNSSAARFGVSLKPLTLDGALVPAGETWVAQVLSSHQPLEGEETQFERPDGGRWTALVQASPLFDGEGRIAGVISTMTDITHLKTEQTVKSYLSAIVDSSDDAIISKDLNGVIQSWNLSAERLFGYSASQAIGRHISFLIPPDRLNEEERILARLRAGERIYHFDTVRVRSDGTFIDISLTISPIRNDLGRIVGASKIARDISHRKRIENQNYELIRQLKEADFRKNEFLAMLGHELRNPLNPIRNAVAMLRLSVGEDDPDLNWCMEVIDRQVVHLVRLIDDLLDISRITRNKLELRQERVDLKSVIEGAVELSRPLIEEQRHELHVSLPDERIELHADSVRLSQVFMNLLNNAAKYMDAGGQIWLTALRDGDGVTISVRDTGIGIPSDKLPRLFDMFYQVEENQPRSQGGLGIGLALVHRLIEMHGGVVTAHSEGIGFGSELVVRLPVASGPETPPATSALQAPPANGARRILVVDDNQDAATSLAMLLKLMGNEIETAYDGVAALDAIDNFRPDVVLLDIGLPRLNGYDVAREIRRRPKGQELLLIALTGWGQDEDVRQSREAGFDHHMVKPVDHLLLRTLLEESNAPA